MGNRLIRRKRNWVVRMDVIAHGLLEWDLRPCLGYRVRREVARLIHREFKCIKHDETGN